MRLVKGETTLFIRNTKKLQNWRQFRKAGKIQHFGPNYKTNSKTTRTKNVTCFFGQRTEPEYVHCTTLYLKALKLSVCYDTAI